MQPGGRTLRIHESRFVPVKEPQQSAISGLVAAFRGIVHRAFVELRRQRVEVLLGPGRISWGSRRSSCGLSCVYAAGGGCFGG